MDPLSRKLFKSREAREKLRGMGGIMSSSPELAQTVAKFANGGPTELQIPRVRSAIQEQGMSFPSWRMLSRSQRAALGYPVSELGGQLAFDRFGVGLGTVDRNARFTPSGVNVSDVSVPMTAEEAWAASNEFAGVNDQDAAAIAADTRKTLAATPSTPAAKASASADTPVNTEPTEDTPASSEDEGSADPVRTGAAIGSGDFNTTYEQMLDRLAGIMGEDSDEDKKKKTMANLAMIGLAIAAGQSPDALTNIAQGALVGMKGMQEAEAAEKATQRELKLTALKMAADEVELNRRLQNALDVANVRTASGTGTYTPERLYQQNLSAILSNPDMFDVFTGNVVDPLKARQLAQRLSERGMTVGGTAPAAGPAAGDVVDGYRFLGGDPADQGSWEKVE